MADTRIVDFTEELALTKERRHKGRLMISTPVRVRGVAATDQSWDESTTTINLSPTGILIETANPAYYRGMKVTVILPFEESAAVAQSEQEGIVVRVSESRNGRRAVAISLESGVCQDRAHAAGETLHHEPRELDPVDRHSRQMPESILPLIVVLDEESATRESIKTYLSGEGYEVITVSKVVEARNVLNGCNPALIIAQIEGEGMPGYDLCAYCKQTPRLKVVPVLLMTSSAYPSDYAKAHSLGAIVCMAKPYRRERLGHVVRLLAPPLNADKKAKPARPGDASRRACGSRSRGFASVTVR
jgi:CheY-like chemotaxis protein